MVACDDDGCGGGPGCTPPVGVRSDLATTAGPGLFYLIVDGFDNGGWACPCGDFDIGLTGF